MSHFFSFSSIILLAVHGYLFWKLRQAFGGGRWQIPVLLFFLSLLALLVFRRHDLAGWQQQFMDFSYIWFGFLLFVCVLLLASDLLALLLFLLKTFSGGNFSWSFSPTRGTLLCLILAFGITAYALYSAHNPQFKHITISSAKLPQEFSTTHPLRIVLLTDVHLNEKLGPEYLRKVAALVKSQQPDIIAVTGDLVDTDMSGRDEDAAILRNLTATYGKYAVIGNHEVHRGIANSRAFIRDAGLTLLENRAVPDESGIIVVGVNDRSMRGDGHSQTPGGTREGRPGGYSSTDLAEIINDLNTSTGMYVAAFEVSGDALQDAGSAATNSAKISPFVLLLRHRPQLEENEIGLVDLQLSGHTHGGQIWPGKYLVRAANNNVEQGLTVYNRAGQGKTSLYVSNGVGYWGPPMRFLAPPEVTVIDLVRDVK